MDDHGELSRRRDPVRDAAGRNRRGALLTNIACLVMLKHGMFAHLAGSLSDVRNHAIMNAAVVLAAFLTWASGTMWPDALAALGILCANASAAEHIWLAAREPPLIDA